MTEEFEEAGYTANPRIPESAHLSRRQKRMVEAFGSLRGQCRQGPGSGLAWEVVLP